MLQEHYGKLRFRVFDTRENMGRSAAADAADALRAILSMKDTANVVFAAAPSQNEMLRFLRLEKGVEWSRVNAFHMDEYIGLPTGDPRSFGGYLDDAVFNHLPFASIHRLNGMNEPATECERYASLLRDNPTDIVLMGIGENGHIAFNDPPVADFSDPKLVKVVELEQPCRQQQVNDGCFPDLDSVPKLALTLTIPALVRARGLFCVVPGNRKATALRDTLIGPVAVSCPASILRETDGVTVYADNEAAYLL